VKQGKQGIYARYIKRILDVLLSGCALVVLSPVLLIVAVLVRTKLGSPVIFCQERPGKDEKIFKMYKFRSMTDARDENGELLPDEVRLTKFGRALRSTSLDELPELWNIFKGDMSIVGPRPQLVRDMVFMTPEQRLRHTVMPGLTGLAQVSGRNAISWEDKLAADLRYIRQITFLGDVKIVLLTVRKVFFREDISADGMDTAEDLGDYLLRTAQVSEEAYQELQEESRELLIAAGK
jgi:undecaprenyl phosphate N,N'-diacetylbacillosamine 1-phosphate transferase